MSGFSTPSRSDSPAQIVRTIGRLAQILIELRDEYAERPRDDTMTQIEQRLDELMELRESLHSRLAEEQPAES
jgi:predicted component of type VI protein secretion system